MHKFRLRDADLRIKILKFNRSSDYIGLFLSRFERIKNSRLSLAVALSPDTLTNLEAMP